MLELYAAAMARDSSNPPLLVRSERGTPFICSPNSLSSLSLIITTITHTHTHYPYDACLFTHTKQTATLLSPLSRLVSLSPSSTSSTSSFASPLAASLANARPPFARLHSPSRPTRVVAASRARSRASSCRDGRSLFPTPASSRAVVAFVDRSRRDDPNERRERARARHRARPTEV